MPSATTQQCPGEVHPVDHQRGQLQAGQVGRHQLAQGFLGRGDEPSRDRRLAGPLGRLGGAGADGFKAQAVAAGGQFAQHLLQRHALQQVG